MELCSDNHEEVCYEGRVCPFCKAIAEKNDEISVLEEKVKHLEDKIDDLNIELTNLNNKLSEEQSDKF